MATQPEEDRNPIDEAEWNTWEIEGESEDALADDKSDLADKPDPQVEPFRVQEDIGPRIPVWYGVRSCKDQDRAIAEMKPHFEQWVAKTIASRPESTAIAKGWHSGEIWWQNRSTNGKRRCKGGFRKLIVYVDFA